MDKLYQLVLFYMVYCDIARTPIQYKLCLQIMQGFLVLVQDSQIILFTLWTKLMFYLKTNSWLNKLKNKIKMYGIQNLKEI